MTSNLVLFVVVLTAAAVGASIVVTKPGDYYNPTTTPEITTPETTTPQTARPKVEKKKNQEHMSTDRVPQEELEADFWRDNAMHTLHDKLNLKLNKNRAKNVIFFLGDGMSIPTLMAARVYKGQLKNHTGEEEKLAFEEFPVSGLVKTYCVNAQVPDSACTATAYLSGVKTNYGTLGVTANVTRGQCEGQKHAGNRVSSLAKWALDAGLDAGIVTTTRVTHASPAGAYAHAAERDWESDANMSDEQKAAGCHDIAYQLIRENPGQQFKVIMGGGKAEFLPKNMTGKRMDGLNLIKDWHMDKISKNVSHKYVTDIDGLNSAVIVDQPDYLLGLFHNSHLDFRLQAERTQPTLEEMTTSAIKTLEKSGNGYFLFVEGGLIDIAHHDNWAKLALDETVELSKAVERAALMTDADDTLIIVSSDHAHVFSVSGYPSRGNDILGVVDTHMADDDVPYLSLAYANGPGYRHEVNKTRADVTQEKNFITRHPKFVYGAGVPRNSESHGGDDVGVFARGPWQHTFGGHYEQHLIPHLLAHAMCLGRGVELHGGCGQDSRVRIQFAASGAEKLPKSLYLLLISVCALIFTNGLLR